MVDLWKSIQQSRRSAVRRVLRMFQYADPATGADVTIPVDGRETTLSQDGSPDTVSVKYAQFYECGHSLDSPLGGRCFACRGLSCQACHGSCSSCQQPCCMQCSRYERLEDSSSGLRFCCGCFHGRRRVRLAKGVVLVLLSPLGIFVKA